MKFKDWIRALEEAATDTGDIARFARPVIGGPRRTYPPAALTDGKTDEKKRKKDM